MVTLGLVLDGSGFVRRFRTIAGKVSEGTTLKKMFTGLNAPRVPWSSWMRTSPHRPPWPVWVAQGYRYLVVRIGRLKPKLGMGAGQHYTVNLVVNESGKTATALT